MDLVRREIDCWKIEIKQKSETIPKPNLGWTGPVYPRASLALLGGA
ncbi:hypothetical protein BGE01nite_22270 [Brevifollis gellanilyticus]|uniref:Uncharacterized protein n=1 Tax=Brevifollis gellanilyticus TaxID=748831 RepID=A0A512M868_9BACT|nr:hypothetical protein BGE01nite_22270 [Brevifollis gellanilyticus]